MTAEAAPLSDELLLLMRHHGFHCDTEQSWVVPNGALPAIRATWYPRGKFGVLEVETLLKDHRIINECFAGVGEGRAGIADGLQNFSMNSFHVLLAAFWGRDDPEQVTSEDWIIGGKRYRAYIGNFGTRRSSEAEPSVPSQLFPTIRRAVELEPLSGTCHWVRCFYADVRGAKTIEALVDNKPWHAGVAALRAVPWASSIEFYTVRSFLVLRAAA